MKLRTIGLLLFAASLVFSMVVSIQAQEKEEEEKLTEAEKDEILKRLRKIDPSKLYVDLSGKMYLEWGHFHGFKYDGSSDWGKVGRWGIDTSRFIYTYDTNDITGFVPVNYSYNDDNTFRMKRAYLTLKKRIGEIFSVKLTADINPTGSDFMFLKYGYVQVYKDFGPISLKGQAGKIGTPVIGITDQLSDLRWIGKNYLDDSKYVLNGKSFDNSSDIGALFSMNIMKMVTMTYTFTNGEGYKYDDSEAYGGKSHTVLVSGNWERYKQIYINFYFRWEDVNKHELDIIDIATGDVVRYQGLARRWYYGFGLAWYSDVVKFGGNVFVPQWKYAKVIYPITSVVSSYRENFLLVDAWFHANFGAISPARILLISKVAYGVEFKSLTGNGRQAHHTLVTGAGLGYQFNKYLRFAAYYENVKWWVDTRFHNRTLKDPDPTRNVYVKVEAKY